MRTQGALQAAPAAEPFIDGYLAYLLARASQLISAEFHVVVRRSRLPVLQWRVLATLHDGDPLTVSQLAHEVLSKQPTVTKLVQRMAEQGWVVLQACPTDQRRTLVAVTAAGRRLVKPLVEEAKAHETQVLRALGATEKAALRKLLGKLAVSAVSSR